MKKTQESTKKKIPIITKSPAKKKRRSKFLIYLAIIMVLATASGAGAGFVLWSLTDLPKIKSLESYTPFESTLIYSKDNVLLAELYFERRTFVKHFDIPNHVKNAFIAVEDARFYEHHGIDLFRVLGAMFRDIKAGAIVQGGSTITQQLSKLLFLDSERSMTRKIKEAALSLQIEKQYTKDEIIGLYLNQAYFGSRAYGIEAAAQTYFGKTTQQLNVPEAALLAAMLKAPTTYSPFVNAEKSLTRRNFVLYRMLENGFIDNNQYKVYIKEPLPKTMQKRRYSAPYYVEEIKKTLEPKFGDRLYKDGMKIYTSLDYKMQKVAEEAVAHGINEIEKRRKGNIQAALIAIDLKTGEIKAMVGGTDFWDTQFNRATLAMRQTGSSFKPFVYLTALKKGYTTEDVIEDKPISFYNEATGQVWSPQNYEREYMGPVSLRTALAHSLNAATVGLAENIGIKHVIETAKELGITSKIEPYLSSALGASSITLREMVYAYAAFATGNKLPVISILSITTRDGLTEDIRYAQPEQVIDSGILEEIRDLLRAVVLEGTGHAAANIGRPVYGKTGTTNDFTDAWFVGFDDDVAVGVWVGRDNNKPIGEKETGAMAALPIWIEFMKNK